MHSTRRRDKLLDLIFKKKILHLIAALSKTCHICESSHVNIWLCCSIKLYINRRIALIHMFTYFMVST